MRIPAGNGAPQCEDVRIKPACLLQRLDGLVVFALLEIKPAKIILGSGKIWGYCYDLEIFLDGQVEMIRLLRAPGFGIQPLDGFRDFLRKGGGRAQ